MPKSPQSPSRRLRRWITCGSAALLVMLGGFEIAVRTAEIPASLFDEVKGTPVLLDRHGSLIAELPGRESRLQFPVSRNEMHPWLLRAAVGLEDRRFWEHPGIDPQAIAAALLSNLRHGRVVSGASTITQQLIKNARAPARRTLSVKLSEALAAIKLERQWSKEQIIERYLNIVDYGNRFRGVEAAAKQYFGVEAKRLSPAQAIFLAALPRAPSLYNPWSHPQAAAARYRDSLDRLLDAGLLTPEQRREWDTLPTVRPRQPVVWKAPHYVAWLRQQSPDLEGIVHCTIDLRFQTRAETIVSHHLQRLRLHGARDAAVVILDHLDGSVRAWIGGSDWESARGQVNGVTLPRSAGSILKPLLYLQAVERRVLTAATLLPDTPDAIRAEYLDYDPRNYDQRFWGPVRMREALANSLNVPAVVTLARLGARQAFNALQHAGIRMSRDLDDYGAGLILGNAEIRLLDITAAFGVFANEGALVLPRLCRDSPQARRIIASPESAQILADILSDNDARRKSFGPFTPLAFENRRIPCKTGTSSGFRDAWTVGATGRHCIGVWVGNVSGAPMRELASVTGPAPLWRDLVVQLFDSDPDLPAPVPSARLSAIEVCSVTGALPADVSPGRVTEWFLTGTEPVEKASAYYQSDADGKRQLILPAAFEVWCHSSHNYLGARAAAAQSLRIVHPRAGSTFVLDPHLPLRRQRIELRAAGATGGVQWLLDGRPYAHCQPEDSITWPLSPGAHEVSVTDGKAAASVSFTVE